jgi:hypothetical protein
MLRRLLLVALLAVGALGASNAPITPSVQTQCRLNATHAFARYEYTNANAFAITLPVGVKNYMIPGPLSQGQPTLFLAGGPYTAHSIIFNCAAQLQTAWVLQSDNSATTTIRSIIASCPATPCAQLVGADVPATQSKLVARHACSCVQPTKTAWADYTNFTCTSTFDVVNSGVAPITVAAQSAQNLVSGPILRIAQQLETFPVGLSVHAIEVDWACNAGPNAQLAVLLRDASDAASVAVASGFASYVRDPIQGGADNYIPTHAPAFPALSTFKSVATLDLPRCDGLHCGVDAQCGAGYAIFIPEGVDAISVGQNGIAYGGAQCVYMTPVNSTVNYALIQNELVMGNATRANFYNASLGLWRQDSHTADTDHFVLQFSAPVAISEIIKTLVATVAADADLGDNIGLAEPRDVAFNDTVRARAILMRQCMDFTARPLGEGFALMLEAVNAWGDEAAAHIAENFERGLTRYGYNEVGTVTLFNFFQFGGLRATSDITLLSEFYEVDPARYLAGPSLASITSLYGLLGYGLAEAQAYVRVRDALMARVDQWVDTIVPLPPFPPGTWLPGQQAFSQYGLATTYTFAQAQAVAAPFDLRVMLSEASDLDVALVNTTNIYFWTENGDLTPFISLSELKSGVIAQSDFIAFTRMTLFVTLYLEYSGRRSFLKRGRSGGARAVSVSDMYRPVTSDEARAALHAYVQRLGDDMDEASDPSRLLRDVRAERPVDEESKQLFALLAQEHSAKAARHHGPPAKGDGGGTLVPPIPILSLEATRQHAYECAVYLTISVFEFATSPEVAEGDTVGSYAPFTVLPKVNTIARAGAFDGIMDVVVPTVLNQTRLTIERAYTTGGISLVMRDHLLYLINDYFVVFGSTEHGDPEIAERMSRSVVDARYIGITARRGVSVGYVGLMRDCLKRGRSTAADTNSDLRANAFNAGTMHMIKIYPGISLPPMWNPTWLDDPATRDLMLASAPITAVFAHEVGHALSTLVTKFDRDGRAIDWASPADKARVNAQTLCLNNYLNSIPAFYGATHNTSTIIAEEGYSDWWAVRILLDLTNARHAAQNITGEQRRSELRHVCYGYAGAWALAWSRATEYDYQQNAERVHPIPDNRATVPLMFAEFYEAFESEAMRPPDAPYPAGIPRCGNLGLVS